jgi:RNA polymerase-binding transcription factor DksA
MSITTSRVRHRNITTRQLTNARALLEDQWRRQIADIVALSRDLPSSLAERGEASRRGDLHVTARLMDAAQQQLNETKAALARLDARTYGYCVHCRKPIAPERLEVLPAARYCVTCQTASATGRQP